MDQVASVDDFFTILYTLLTTKLGIDSVSLDEIQEILNVVELVPKFNELYNMVDFEEFSKEVALKNKCVIDSTDEDSICIEPLEENSKLMEKYSEVSKILEGAIKIYYIAEELSFSSDEVVSLVLGSPDQTCFVDYYLSDFSLDVSFFTDGNVEVKDAMTISEDNELLFGRNVTITDSTFLVEAYKRDDIVEKIDVRSKFIEVFHLLNLTNNIRAGIIGEYEKVNDSPKVYKLRKQ